MMDWEQVKHRYKDGDAKQIYGVGTGGPVRKRLCDYIAENFLNCNSFFEFGCSAGFNLARIKYNVSDAKYEGIDINPDAVIYGQKQGNNVNIGDEDTLKTYPDEAFDVVFTSSVMNHIPDEAFQYIMDELKRIAKKAVICMEGNVSLEPDYYIHAWETCGFKNVETAGKGDWVTYHIWRWDK